MKIITFTILITLAICSCKKSDDSKTTNPPGNNQDSLYNFTYSGSMLIDSPISFNAIAPAGSTFYWTFSDYSMSYQQSLIHTYTDPHTYNTRFNQSATLYVSNNGIHTVTKNIHLHTGIVYDTGMRHWTGGYFSLYGGCCAGMYPHNLNDTDFSVTALSDSTISVWGQQIPYDGKNRFIGLDTHNSPCISFSKDTLFFSYTGGGLGGGTSIKYYSVK